MYCSKLRGAVVSWTDKREKRVAGLWSGDFDNRLGVFLGVRTMRKSPYPCSDRIPQRLHMSRDDDAYRCFWRLMKLSLEESEELLPFHLMLSSYFVLRGRELNRGLEDYEPSVQPYTTPYIPNSIAGSKAHS